MRILTVLVVLAGSAHADVAPTLPAVGVAASASSTLTAKSKTYDAWHVLVPDVTHAQFWCEGKPDEGVGESLTLAFASTKVASLTIRAGVWRTDELYRANNRIAQLDVTTDDGRVQHVAIPAERTDVEVPIGGAAIKRITIAIAKVNKGRMNDTCLSEVEVHTTPAATVIADADVAAAAALEPDATALLTAIDDCSAAALGALAKFPVTYKDTIKKGVQTFKDAKALAKGCKAKFSTMGSSHGAMRARAEGPRKVMLDNNDTFEFHVVLDAGHWKLTSLVDNTP